MTSLFKTSSILCTMLLVLLSHYNASSQAPNIILILTDDMGYADVGFNNGAADIATPNIDALADAGTRFNSAYVTHPFCGPSRAGLMTGRYPHEFGSQFNLSDTDTTNGVPLSETFFSNVLKTAGYNTGIIGKWHLGQPTGYRPNQRGFDYFYGMLYGGHVYVTGGGGGSTQYMSPLRENEGLAGEANGLYITDLFSDKGVEFINNAETNDNQPFFLFMSYNAPHTPLQALASDKTALTSPPHSFTYSDTSRHDYAAMVYSVDRGVKKLVDALIANGEFDNTLIVFLSDNGGRTDQGALNTPLRGVKGDTFEGGFRVPMFMHWPNGGNGIPVQDYNFNVSSLDLYPTFVNLAGGAIPGGKEIDGKDILNDIKNNTDARAGESIYAIRHQAINKLGIRRGQYKAYRDTGNNFTNPWRLFDINANIGEDFGQALDVVNNQTNKAVLEAMLTDAYQWSTTHTEPLFFDSPAAKDTWDTTHKNTTPTWQENAFEGYTALSIEDIELKQNVSGYIYPNPVESNLTIKFNTPITESVDIIIYDVQGRPIQINTNLKATNSSGISLILNAFLSNGTYLLKVKSTLGIFSKSFVVKQ